jgi:hypothetical protein
MKMRIKRKQFWWTWAAKEIELHFMGFFVCHDFVHKLGFARIKHQLKD